MADQPTRVVIWLDDERDPDQVPWSQMISKSFPDADEVRWVKTAQAARMAIMCAAEGHGQQLVAVSLDNDLGSNEVEGKYVANWIEAVVHKGMLSEPFTLNAHTANSVAHDQMTMAFASIRRMWSDSG